MRPAQRMDSLRRNVADRCWEAVPSRLWRRRRARALFSVTMMLLCISGCTSSYRLPWLPFSWNDRDTHRHNADDESYAIVQEKADGTPWGLPQALSIQPDPRSRLFDASDPSDPALPEPGPHLHEYELPPLTPRPDRFSKLDVAKIELPEPVPATGSGASESDSAILQVSAETPATETSPADGDSAMSDGDGTSIGGLKIQSIPREYWAAVPRACLARMLEFESIRLEYRRTFGQEPSSELRDPSRRLTLDDIVELGQINARDFQTQKETLYRRALALTLRRYDFRTKLATGGNGVGTDYRHARDGGTTTDTLTVDPGVQLDRMLATGGTVVAKFANNVVLTFNGADGFAADVGSDLMFELSQSLLQRDVLLNPLIQAERDVVYAARDYARFRKQFFFDLSKQYYDLLSTYRRIEINSQNYFSLVRNFEQAQSEVRSGIRTAPNQVAVDQFEQSMLGGRRDLITTCNGIEGAFDNLKVRVGLPTEMPINLNLSELEHLTLRDEFEVAAERVRRWRSRLELRRNTEPLDRREILNASVFLTERMIEWQKLQKLLDQETPGLAELDKLGARLLVDQARLNSEAAEQDLVQARNANPPTPPILLYQWTINVIDQRLELLIRQARLAERLGLDSSRIRAIDQQLAGFQQQVDVMHDRLGEMLREAQQGGQVVTLAQPIQELRRDAEQLLATITAAVQSTDEFIEALPPPAAEDEALAQTVEDADRLLLESRKLLESAGLGLVPLEIASDEALATALVQRLDLMNKRGELADDWRGVKLRGDDLRSILNLKASQLVETRDNRPFGFDLDESSTNLNLQLDLPFNRMQQRNNFRSALIDYQAGKRELTEFEDRTIKLAIRNELRDLELTRVQYPISVAQAALAAEQVTSIRLSLSLGIPNVRIPDLLDALDDSRTALINVANSRIDYITQRAQFALDLELMQLDEEGFWQQIYDDDYQPQPQLQYPLEAGETYGEIPDFLRVSDSIRRMRDHSVPGWTAPAVPASEETSVLPASASTTSSQPDVFSQISLPLPEPFESGATSIVPASLSRPAKSEAPEQPQVSTESKGWKPTRR
jgi:hypothetical protein